MSARIVIGQRWSSHADPDLGLGIVVEAGTRRLTVDWPAVGETRTYATDSAPLSRIVYASGDRVRDHQEQEYEVLETRIEHDLYSYLCRDADGETRCLREIELSCFVQFTSPRQRLFSGLFDDNRRFELRVETLRQLDRLQRSPVRGLLGSRSRLLPHQVYIAERVAIRHHPRVLLADEVGLGKTIEAGMILHSQVLNAQARRILILVPDSLVHQWLVELLRRFNLPFAVFDRDRIDALACTGTGNPFETEQRVICSLDLLGSDSALQALALEAGWDTVVVDEAHHLRWSPAAVSPEYELVRRFAEACPGLLLLTATPEQAGLEGHFSRLRLLDPARFHDYDAFVEAEADYPRLSGLVEALRDTGDRLSPAMKAELSRRLGDIDARIDSVAGRRAIVDELIDRHGTGRVLFRNSRRTVSGFPQRDIQPQAVPGWQRYLADGWQPVEPDDWLYPESSRPDSEWIDWDGRVAWLVGQAASLKGEKLLVICHRAQTAIELDKHLNLRAGIRCTVFHEGMSIVERDRAAAYFAESDAGAQVLVCSEIGSEGRNFQFSRHLVLFDLPLDPDLVEQRIGRLDRIGQGERISIHLPYLAGSAQETLYHWYQRGLDQFARSNGVGYTIYEQLAERLRAVLGLTGEALDELIADTAALVQSIRERQESGRDRLLELNSCDPDHAEQLIRLIEAEEQSPALERYMGRLFDTFGVDHEYHSAQAEILRPGLHMLGEHFPGLEADGMTVTFDRQRALSREDMTFLSWEHPMVVDSMEMVMADGLGGAVVATAAIKQLAPGTMLLEAIYSVAVSAPAELRLERFLGLQPMRFVLGTDGHDVGSGVPDDVLNRLCETVPQGIARNIVERIRAPLEQLIDSANRRAEQKLPEIRTDALDRARSILGAELDRLTALQRLNPSVRDEEIEFIRRQLSESEAGIDRATARLQALRVIVTT